MDWNNTTQHYSNHQPDHNKAVTYIMLGITALGCLGNTVAIVMILSFKKFRRSSIAFICHQCFLDLIRGLYGFLYGIYLLNMTAIPACSAVGVTYVLFVTLAAYNLLAIVVNEECEMQRPSANRDKNHFCVVFGIIVLWFTCILIHMGVAFLPKEPEYIPEVGSCIFSYGTPSNLVLHILWIILISMAIFLTLLHFLSMFCRIKYKAKSLKWALIHRSLLRDVFSKQDIDVDPKSVQKSCHSNNLCSHLYLRRIKILSSMAVTFVLFWYPLFLLTIIDHNFTYPKPLYKALTILSWCHPATTSIFVFFILHDMSNKDGLLRRIYSDVYPMMQFYGNPTHHPIINSEWDTVNTGILNNHFSSAETSNDLDPEGQTLLPKESEAANNEETRSIVLTNEAPCTIQTPIIIEQWDCSPTSPGKQRKN
ncbi:hypothetical protein DPMN_054919 [Dreissena polymorpha]|uniref:G-protein coupled receptors family 1 profile domain-containing protein n=1 Tax=Dreissena polymorpha TaxID=45954 RepID=A0A9D4CQE1_DREPO|nr:hypothetical protein DPMN_054919 [Dreissena polymorpha]